MTWRFGDIDPSPARADVLVSFAPDGDELGITGFGADSTVDTRSYAAVAPRPARRGVDPRGSCARRGHPRPGRAGGPTGVARNRCRAPRAPRLEAARGGGGAGECCRAQPIPRRPSGHLRLDRGRDGHGRRIIPPRCSGPRLREPGGHRRPSPRGGAGRDEPRAGPRRHRCGDQPGRAMAAGGVRRLRRPARRRTARPTTLGRAIAAGATRRSAGRSCREPPTSTPAPGTCRRSTSRPGWPAGSSPSGWGARAAAVYDEASSGHVRGAGARAGGLPLQKLVPALAGAPGATCPVRRRDPGALCMVVLVGTVATPTFALTSQMLAQLKTPAGMKKGR